MEILRSNVGELDQPVGPYVHCVLHNKILYTSGITAFGTEAQSGAISDQAEAIFLQLSQIAATHQTSLENLIKVTVFVTDLSDMQSLRDCLFRLYGNHLPASSLIKIESLFASELLIEIEAIIAL